MDAVDLPHVRLQRASLREGLLAELTLVRADTCHAYRAEERRSRLKPSTCKRKQEDVNRNHV